MQRTGPAAGQPQHVVVVGGGLSGLAAAWRLSRSGARVTVLEQSDRFGGKLWTGPLGDLEVDLGAESFLARRPEALDLVAELGLTDRLVHPVTAAATVYSRGTLHPLPAGTVMGVPTSTAGLAGLLTAAELARVEAEPRLPAPPLEHDTDVRSWVQGRFGPAVVDRLVEHFGSLQKLLAASIDDLLTVDGVGESRARSIREGLSRLAESSILERYV